MEPYKAKKMPLEFNKSSELLKLVCDVNEIYGEYKGFLRNMSYDYKFFLESAFISDIFYSFQIDGAKLSKEYMFHTQYMNNDNESAEFNNLKKSLLIGLNDTTNANISIETINRINKTLFLNCKKTNDTKGSGKFRKKQNFLLKPGLAGSSIAFIPPVYKEVNNLMNDLFNYINNNDELFFLSILLTHYQFEKIHPYISGNGKIGRLLISLQYSMYKKEPPILFISEAIDNVKNTYFTLLGEDGKEDVDKFLKVLLQCIIDQCTINIKKIKKLNKIYNEDYEKFRTVIGGSTIYKVFPVIVKKIVFTTNDLVKECNLHINSVNKVLNKMVDEGYLIKEKKKNTNRVTFCYKNMYDIFVN